MAGTAADVHFFPIRHHSAACAVHLAAALAEIRPAALLIEAPSDFAAVLPSLADPRIVPPVAIVSMPQRDSESSSVVYFPVCDHSPELIALRWAFAQAIQFEAIDLPSCDAAMLSGLSSATPGRPLLLTREEPFTTSAYVRALCERIGARDGDEAWDRLFETRLCDGDWRLFFDAVGTYCRHLRDSSSPSVLRSDGTLAREAHMRRCIRAAVGRAAAGETQGSIAVVIGGFHLPALLAAADPGDPEPLGEPPTDAAAAARIALIRYGFARLDRANGYAAGLPMPGYYDRLWRASAKADANSVWDRVAIDCLVGFADRLRKQQPDLRFGTPAIVAAAETAVRLSRLRQLPGPGRSELVDAVRATAVKDAIELDAAPVLAAFAAYLTGDRLGDVPPGHHALPLVEDVRAKARALAFSLDRAAPATRDLDLWRKPRHRAASRFLHALDLIGAGFARRIAGPDPRARRRTMNLHEKWTYAWGPSVEAALFDRIGDGDRLESVCRVEVLRRLRGLQESGHGREAPPAAALFVDSVRAGLTSELPAIAAAVDEVLAEAEALPGLLVAFRLLASTVVLPGEREELGGTADRLIRHCYRRIVARLATLGDLDRPAAIDAARRLADLASSVAAPDDDGPVLERELLDEAISELLAGPITPFLLGAVGAIARMLEVIDENRFEAMVRAAFAGVSLDPADRVAALSGIVATVPRFFVGSGALIELTDAFLAGLDDTQFLAVLPELRLAFSELNPGEIDRIAARLPGLHGTAADALRLPAAELVANLEASRRLTELWLTEGTAAWLGIEP